MDDQNGKTFHLVEKRTVARPIDEVFAYAADFANSQEWDPGVKSATKSSEGPLGVGTTYDLVGHFGPSTIDMKYQVTAYEPDSRVVLDGAGNGFKSRDEMEFDISGEGTTIIYTADITLTNFLRFLGPLMKGPMKRMGEKALNGLAQKLSS